MPKAMTHNTKKMDIELPFSASTALVVTRTGGASVVDVVEVVVAGVVAFPVSVILLKVTLRVGVDGFIAFSWLTEALRVDTDESFCFASVDSSVVRTVDEKARSQQRTKCHFTIMVTTTNLSYNRHFHIYLQSFSTLSKKFQNFVEFSFEKLLCSESLES